MPEATEETARECETLRNCQRLHHPEQRPRVQQAAEGPPLQDRVRYQHIPVLHPGPAGRRQGRVYENHQSPGSGEFSADNDGHWYFSHGLN